MAARQIIVDPNDPAVLKATAITLDHLVNAMGEGVAVAVSLVMVEQVLINIVDDDGPMPEARLQMVERLLGAITGHVEQHIKAARRRARGEKETIH